MGVQRTLAFYLGMQLPQQPTGEGSLRRSGQPQGLEDKDQFLTHARSVPCPFPNGRRRCPGGIQPGVQVKEAGSLELCAEES